MPFARNTLGRLWLSTSLLWPGMLASTSQAAGLTVITHGLNGTTTGWVEGMGDAFSQRLGGGVPVFRLHINELSGTFTNWVTPVSGGDPLLHPSGEVIVLLDWGAVAGGTPDTVAVADYVAPLLLETNLIPGLAGHAPAELRCHLVGHSRGGSLVCELSRRLGEAGVWVDQVTGLDTRPVGSDGEGRAYENVLFADSYYQKENFFVNGDEIEGSFWRQQTNVSGGYSSFLINGHSDVHLWYHGTIDLETPTSDGDTDGGPIVLDETMRARWWRSYEQAGTNSGFIYRYHGGGDRLGTDSPNGTYSTPVREGFNRFYDLGAGVANGSRTGLQSNSGEWPNPIRVDLTTTNVVQPGETATLELYWQWGQPNTSTQSVQVLADPDHNPLNGNEIPLDEGFATGTDTNRVVRGTIEVSFDGAIPPGDYRLFVKMTASGRTRFLDAPQTIGVIASAAPFRLDITAATNSVVVLGVTGSPGQTAVLEMALDALPWTPVATNTLTSTRWEFEEPIDPSAGFVLFRARLLEP